jgi:hypothetical protein
MNIPNFIFSGVYAYCGAVREVGADDKRGSGGMNGCGIYNPKP